MADPVERCPGATPPTPDAAPADPRPALARAPCLAAWVPPVIVAVRLPDCGLDAHLTFPGAWTPRRSRH